MDIVLMVSVTVCLCVRAKNTSQNVVLTWQEQVLWWTLEVDLSYFGDIKHWLLIGGYISLPAVTCYSNMMSLKQYGKRHNSSSVMDGMINRSDPVDVDGVQRLLGPDVVATSCLRNGTAPHHAPRLRINVSGQPFELPVALLARHPGNCGRCS